MFSLILTAAATTAGVFDLLSAFIASVGFPIAAFLIMVKINKDQTAAHKEEMDAVKQALKENTEAINNLRVELTRKGGN